MRNVLSTTALSLALAGSVAFSGVQGNVTTAQAGAEPAGFSVPHQVKASPELVEQAKKDGVKLAEHNAVTKMLNNKGVKFQEAGDNNVTYKATGDTQNMLVFLVKFADGTAPKGAPTDPVDAEYFQDLIFGDSYDPYELEEFKQYDGPDVPKDRTMQNIYSENSYDSVTLKGDKLEKWVELPKTADYYLGQDNGDVDNENGYAHMGELVSDLIEEVDGEIDFSKYAVDGKLPNVFIVHAGTGAEWSRDPAQIWSHKWDLPSALFYGEYYQSGNFDFADTNGDGNVDAEEEAAWMAENEHKWTADGVEIGTYGIQPELGGNIAGYNYKTGGYDDAKKTGPYPAQAGVFSHEFGHVMGLPDFYDTDYTSEGVGDFSMMAGGSWMSYPATSSAYSGNSPTTFDPFSKVFLGWADPIDVKPGEKKTITLPPVNEAAADNGIVKMEVPGSNGTEYFLFENLQQVGTNKGLGEMGKDAHGLVSWHVDENIISLYQTAGQRANNVENWMNKRFQENQSKTIIDADGNLFDITHYGLSVVQADGNYDLERYNNRGDAGDFFQTGDKLTPNTDNVHTGSYYFWKGNSATPADSGIHVTGIKENKDGSLTATFYYSHDSSK